MPTPNVISGTIYTSRGTVANSRVIINSDISTVTNSVGRYLLDLADLQDGYSDGDVFNIETYDELDNEYILDSITVSGSGQTKNLFLDARNKENKKYPNTGYVNPIVSVGDKPISDLNRFPIQSLEKPLDKMMANNASGQPNYIGEAAPGTPTSSAKWRIRKFIYDDGTTKPPTQEKHANGNSEFNKKWTDRTSYTY